MELAFDLSADDRAEAQRAIAARGNREAVMICAGIVAGATLSLFWPVGTSSDALVRAAIGVGLAVVAYGLSVVIMRIWDRMRSRIIPVRRAYADDLLPGRRRWALTKRWIAEDGPTGTRAFRWEAALDVFRTRNLLVIVISEREVLAVPLALIGERGARAILSKAGSEERA